MVKPVIIVPICAGSDGDENHQPTASDYRKVSLPTTYLEKLGDLWMAHRGDGQKGCNYMLDKLPDGYTVWEKPRINNSQMCDKWCYGHPSGYRFDSVLKFFPHFLYLMGHGLSTGCSCNGCMKSKSTKAPRSVKKSAPGPTPSGRPPGRPPGTTSIGAASIGRPRGRPLVQGPTDDEGTPDIYRKSINRLKQEGTLDALIKEEMSMDWRVERENIGTLLDKTAKQPSYLPRLAELVLFVRRLGDFEEIKYDGGHYVIWNNNTNELARFPKWEAGLVTQVPVEDCSFQDLTAQTPKNNAVNYAGFRVEPLPDPNSKDKKMSKQYTYVYLNQVRPFVFWREHLAGIQQQQWSPSIMHALTVMSTVALVEKYRFKGTWPTAKVFNRAVYIGSELICEGDFVRLLPLEEAEDEITDIMKVQSITLVFTNLNKAIGDEYDDNHPYNSAIYLTGTILTMSKARAFTPQRLIRVLPVSFEQYGPWFQRTEPSRLSKVPFHRVMGRCYDPIAMQIWHPDQTVTGNTTVTSISTGLAGLREAREFARKCDKRIADGKTWLWEECRAQALDLHEINGYDTAAHDGERDPKEWRKHIRILDGTVGAAERNEMQGPLHRVLARSSMTNNSMVNNSALKLMEDINSASVTEADQSGDISRKRSRRALESSGEDGADDFFNQMSMGMDLGLPMDDEQVSYHDEEGEEEDHNQDARRGGGIEIVID